MFTFPTLGVSLAAFVGTAATMLILDGIWLGLVAFPFYRSQIGHLLAEKPDFLTAGVFYLLYVVGVLLLAVFPALASGKGVLGAILAGGLLGLIAYGTYDLTNQATMRDWPLVLSVVDMLWGVFITAMAALGGYLAATWLR